MKCFITSCTRKTTNWYFKRCGLQKYGKNSGKGQIISERARKRYIGRGRRREHPKGTYGCAHCALAYFPGEALWVTFDDVISGQKAPLGWILHNVRFRMRTPFQGAPSVSRDVTFGSHVGHAQWYILYYYSKKKVREPVVHADAITSVTSGSGQGCSQWRHFRSHDFRWRHFW